MQEHDNALSNSEEEHEYTQESRKKQGLSGYELSRNFWDKSFDIQACRAKHAQLFFWIVELSNRLGWKKEFGLPTASTMEALKETNRNVYLRTLRDLEAWGFITIVQPAKNQYQSSVISICHIKYDTAYDRALDTALIQHHTWHRYSTVYGTDTIDKQVNNETKKQINHEHIPSVADRDPVDINSEEGLQVVLPVREKKAAAKPKDYTLTHKLRLEFEKIRPEYRWAGKDGKASKTLIDQIQFRFKKKHDRPATDDEVIFSFNWLVDHLPAFYANKWDMVVLSGKFEAIMLEIEKGPISRGNKKQTLMEKMAVIDAATEELNAQRSDPFKSLADEWLDDTYGTR